MQGGNHPFIFSLYPSKRLCFSNCISFFSFLLGPQYFVTDFFSIIETTGQILLNNLLLDYEAVSQYQLTVAAYSAGFDSGWFDMSAQKGVDSYQELDHGLGGIPGVAYVLSKSKSSGYVYPGIGVVQADERYNENYGGVFWGLSANKIRLYVPSASQYYTTGYVININKGWGGPKNAESLRDASVRVILRPSRPPDFDSAWFEMKSNDPNLSYKEVPHMLNGTVDMTYAQVKVVYRSKKTGSVHEAFEFLGTGSQQSDASGGQYGGLLYAWDSTVVRIWAPNYAGSKKRLDFETIILKQNCSRHSYYCHDGTVDHKHTVVIDTRKAEKLEVGDVVVFKDTR